MRNEQHYRKMLEQNPSATVGFTLAAAMVYAARYGACEPEHHNTDEWSEIARWLKSEYGETLDADQVSDEMDNANKSAAAALLGKLGGSATSPAKQAASRANGRLGGRPRKAAPSA
jgi:hypothetical protein